MMLKEEKPVIIPIHCEIDTPPEWSMIEVNGELIAPVELPTKEESQTILGGEGRVELGKLQMCNKTPILILGSHQLKGKIEKLKEPLTIMKKQYDENQKIESYGVIGVVHQKLMFNQYPKVIMR